MQLKVAESIRDRLFLNEELRNSEQVYQWAKVAMLSFCKH